MYDYLLSIHCNTKHPAIMLTIWHKDENIKNSIILEISKENNPMSIRYYFFKTHKIHTLSPF